jgi:hypothetical protein
MDAGTPGGRVRIAGFSCLHEELRKGNLHNWIRCMTSVCERVYVLDRDSRDGSREVYEQHPKIRWLAGDNNHQSNMGADKHRLLKHLQVSIPADWVLWLDGDTLMDGRLLDGGRAIRRMCAGEKNDVIALGHYNLWRSEEYHRVDSRFDFLHGRGVPMLWRNRPGSAFPPESGWHDSSIPNGLKVDYSRANPSQRPPGGWTRSRYNLIHMGFATDEQIIERVVRNRTYGASEDRFFNVPVSVEPVPANHYPEWFTPRPGPHPTDLEPLEIDEQLLPDVLRSR